MSKNCSVSKFGIISILDSERVGSVIVRILSWLKKHNLEIHLEKETAKMFFSKESGEDLSDIANKVDIILVLGGDGTLLRAARSITRSHNIPILGINLGSLGFLTEVTVNEIFSTLEYILEKGYTLDKRMMLEATVFEEEKQILRECALNDIVIDKGYRNRLIKLCVYIGETWVNTFLGDGIIIASPTGSTAYSLSAGGSIVYPGIHCILLTPICPHILTNRPIIVPDSAKIELSIKSNNEGAFLSIDGQMNTQLNPSHRVVITKSDKVIKLIRIPERNYFQVLRAKLKWGERGIEISKQRC